MKDNGERDKKVQGSGHARVYISCETRKPTRGLCPKEHTIRQGHQECTGERDTRISNMSSGDSIPQAMVDTRKGCHRPWFVNDKVLEAIKDKWQQFTTRSLGVSIIIRAIKDGRVGKEE